MPGPSASIQRDLLIGTTAVAVVTDATLLPFFPDMFRESFGVDDPRHVGMYLAATCLTVMLVLPVWARIERRWSTLRLLTVGQAGAGALALASFAASSVEVFWACSLAMVTFKASYLLVYPYVMRLEDESNHERTIGLLTVIVHLGAIAGATIGGWVLEHYAPRAGYLVMAAGDFAMMFVSMGLVRRGATVPQREAKTHGEERFDPRVVARALAKLGAVMAVFYFAVFMVRPFFVAYWSTLSESGGELVAGWVFSIPAWASLAALALDRRRPPRPRSLWAYLPLIGLGLALQCVPQPAVIIIGRFVFGWGVFRAMVKLDLALFATSPPSRYARDFSRMNLCQQGGVLVAFYAAGAAVAEGGLVWPFFVAIGAMLLVALAHLAVGAAYRPKPVQSPVEASV
ncbi:MAG: MFS transporter [Myxococcota bacterium]